MDCGDYSLVFRPCIAMEQAQRRRFLGYGFYGARRAGPVVERRLTTIAIGHRLLVFRIRSRRLACGSRIRPADRRKWLRPEFLGTSASASTSLLVLMRVLITGGVGFIGSAVARRLIAEGATQSSSSTSWPTRAICFRSRRSDPILPRHSRPGWQKLFAGSRQSAMVADNSRREVSRRAARRVSNHALIFQSAGCRSRIQPFRT